MSANDQARPPRLNHVAISMDPARLDDRGRAELLDFYGDVFGWTEGDNTGEVGNPLIMYTGAFGQFVYLLPGDPYLQAPAMDHFGLQVETIAELEAIVERAIEANGAAVEQIRNGKAQAAGAIVGAVMKETKGRADGAEVNRLIREKLGVG